jgi:pyruvate/2-oxoglutarate dehydrogenase complex dihydrolipoamide acyltransferase (E2) component
MMAADRIIASPYARKLARERGIALPDVSAGGPVGRIVAADILAFAVALPTRRRRQAFSPSRSGLAQFATC